MIRITARRGDIPVPRWEGRLSCRPVFLSSPFSGIGGKKAAAPRVFPPGLLRLPVRALFILILATSAITVHAEQKSPAKGFFLEVPYVRQAENYCGPAVLAMLLRYWNHSADHRELAGRFQPFPKKGLSGLELKNLATAEGFQAYSFAGETPEMLDHLRQGRPLITVIDPSVLTTNNHYVVLVGWDESRREWIVHDPVRGPYQRRPAGEMARQRSRLEYWTLLVIPETPS